MANEPSHSYRSLFSHRRARSHHSVPITTTPVLAQETTTQSTSGSSNSSIFSSATPHSSLSSASSVGSCGTSAPALASSFPVFSSPSLFSFGPLQRKPPKHRHSHSSSNQMSVSHPLPPLPPLPAQPHSQPQPRPASSNRTSHPMSHRSQAPSLPRTKSVQTLENGGNILNSRGQKESSIYQKCLLVIRRLARVPRFDDILAQDIPDLSDIPDPVTPLWRILRRGYPLVTLYNSVRPFSPLVLPPGLSDQRLSKVSCYKFIEACMEEFRLSSEECFMISDLFQDDTTGFVKVINVVIFVLDCLIDEGVIAADEDLTLLDNSSGSGKRTHRQHIVAELVSTELTYVQHLELLQAFKKKVESRGLVSGDTIHQIFSNLNSLLDFQRRFLIRVEQLNGEPEGDQNWGQLFVLYENAFKVYIAYIVNQKKCEEVAMREFERLKETGGTPEMMQMTESPTILTSFLLKPFQRISKYPLLLRELRDKGDTDDQKKEDLTAGIQVIERILGAINDALAREERLETVQDLRDRVDDWKGHHHEYFGELLLHGVFTVLKGDTPGRDQEREYKMYLFETILLCCKEDRIVRQKSKIMSKQSYQKEPKPRLYLKGRIFMANVTQTVAKITNTNINTTQIYWRGDSTLENFLIKFPTEEVMKLWTGAVETQRRKYLAMAEELAAGSSGSSFLRNNPSGMDEDTSMLSHRDSGLPRTESMASVLSRLSVDDQNVPQFQRQPSTTKYPVSVATPGPNFPYTRTHASHFSPTNDSPISTRTSASSGMYGNTASFWSAAGHPPTDSRLSSDHMVRPSISQRPSLPPYTHQHHPSASATSRLRSASSPDIHNHLPSARRSGDVSHIIPEVPPFPSHFAYPPPGAQSGWINGPDGGSIGRPSLTSMASSGSMGGGIPPESSPQADMSQLKIKVHFTPDFASHLVINPTISFNTLRQRIFYKYNQILPDTGFTPETITIKYMLEGDRVTVSTDMDVNDAISAFVDDLAADSTQQPELELFVT